jgi:hypothetical protein
MATNEIITFTNVEERIISVRNTEVLLDRDVAQLYGINTKQVNQAVRNNPDKFPPGYIFTVGIEEMFEVVKNFDRFSAMKHSSNLPTAFTEKGLYMLATILKSKQATHTTIAIVEAFTKLRQLSKLVSALPDTEDEGEQRSLMQKTSELLGDVLGNNDLEVTSDETTVEVNLALMKIKRTVKRGKKDA